MESEDVKIYTPFQITENHFQSPPITHPKHSPLNTSPKYSTPIYATHSQPEILSKTEWTKVLKMSSETVKSNHISSLKIRNSLLRGIPPELRKYIWKWISTTNDTIKQDVFNIRANMVMTPEDKYAKLDDDIEKDCLRTFSDKDSNILNKRKSLTVLLRVYGRMHMDVGYVQGAIIIRNELHMRLNDI